MQDDILTRFKNVIYLALKFIIAVYLEDSMISPAHVQSFSSLPDGRRACFEVISRPEVFIKALVHSEGKLSVFYTQGLPDCALKQLSIRLPPTVGDRLSGLFDCVVSDKGLIPMSKSNPDVKLAVTASMLQNNTFGVTANDVVCPWSKGGRAPTGSTGNTPAVVPPWLEEEAGHKITLVDLRDALTRYAKGSGFSVRLEPPATHYRRPTPAYNC